MTDWVAAHLAAEPVSLVEAEYASLRQEILKRIDLRQQQISILLGFAGIFLGLGVTTNTISLIFPPLAAFLAFAWAQNDGRIRDAARYIREHHECEATGAGYEIYLQERRKRPGFTRPVVVSHGGTFLFTQLMAIGIGLSRFAPSPLEWALLAIDAVSVAMVILLLGRAEK